MKWVSPVIVAVCFLVSTVGTSAHHSYAGFSDHEVSVEGTLEKMMFANPHVTLTIRDKDSAVYTAVWVAAFTLENRGMKPTELKVGDVLVVRGTPARDPAVHDIARLEEVRRVGDGWRWLRNDNGRGPTIVSSR
ncbi:MAG: hypothetical protein HOP16_20555 [Acidobacteria bacterium]|nr:hypothetical protein [Acidobacteriota bacterium]